MGRNLCPPRRKRLLNVRIRMLLQYLLSRHLQATIKGPQDLLLPHLDEEEEEEKDEESVGWAPLWNRRSVAMNPGKDSRKRLRPRLAGVSAEKRRKLDLSQPQERQQQQRGRELLVAEDGAFEPRAKSGGRAWLRAKQTGESEPTQPRPQLSAAHRLPPPPGAPPAKTKNKNETTITPPPPLGAQTPHPTTTTTTLTISFPVIQKAKHQQQRVQCATTLDLSGLTRVSILKSGETNGRPIEFSLILNSSSSSSFSHVNLGERERER